jgi:prepilin-type N-terminal cleavage/methylation domain-containing protein/prepilin-type processing-associated H-X9-DG protein
MRHDRRGFTLIELLVVIAIIAILAAILFPVFAQAREAARKTTCVANEHQIASAVQMYTQDFDEKMPLFFILDPSNSTSGLAWPALLQPYAKNWNVFRCPNMADATDGSGRSIWTTPAYYNPQNLSIWQGYGWNSTFMNYSADCSDFDTSNGSGPPTPLASISKPADTVMFTGSSLEPGSGSWAGSDTAYPVHGGYYPVEAPGIYNSPDGCAFSGGGWGQGSYMGPYGGFEQPRHGNVGGAVCFVDGHVKFMTAGRLAAGTDWSVDRANTDVHIVDRSQYLWDLQ